MSSAWSVGVATVDITPETPQFLVGMGWRTERSKGVYLPLKASALYLNDGVTAAVLLSADLIAIPRPLLQRLRRAASRDAGVPGDHVIACATHTHDAPRISDDMVMAGEVDPAYVRWLEARLRGLIPAAKAAARPAAMRFSRIRSHLGVNRRRWDPAAKEARHAPNPEGAHDRAVDSRWFVDARGRAIASLTSYGCHATACGQYDLGGDYPGFFCEAVRAATGVPALWCQGCGANVRPWFSGTLETYGGGNAEAARQMGQEHAVEVLAGRRRAFPIELGRLQVSRRMIRLPLREPWTYEEYRDGQFGNYAKVLGEDRVRRAYEAAVSQRSLPFEVQVLSLRRDHHLVYWSGEVCTDIGIALKDLCPGEIVTPHGYSNGLVAYIPPRHAFPQGGYEVERSCCYFGLAATLLPEAEDRILAASLALLRRHRQAAAPAE